MRYELLANEYSNVLSQETEFLSEGAPTLIAWGLLAGATGKYVIENGIPDIVLKMADDSLVYQALSIFDPTGIMAWPYIELAMEDAAANPDDVWKQSLVIISCLGVLPGFGLGARLVGKLVASPILLPFWILKPLKSLLVNGGRSVSRNKFMMEEKLPDAILKMGQRNTVKGINMGNSFRKSLKEVFDIDVTDDQIAAFAAKNNIKIAKGLNISQKAITAAKTLGSTIPKVTRGTGKAGRTATAGAMAYDQLKSLFDKKPQKGIGRTPDVMGPKVQFGTIGGGIE